MVGGIKKGGGLVGKWGKSITFVDNLKICVQEWGRCWKY